MTWRSKIGIGSAEIHHIFSIQKIVTAGVSGILAFYLFPYLAPFLRLPGWEWLNAAASGIFAFIIAEILW